MTDFSYEPPESNKFIHTLRKYLQQIGKDEIATLLSYSSYEVFSNGGYSRRRWNELDATVSFLVPVDWIKKFTEEVEKDLLDAVHKVFPSEVGYHILDLEIIPMLEAPPEDESSLSNSA